MTPTELMTELGFRMLEATTETMSVFKNVNQVVEQVGGENMKILPLIDTEKNTITHATLQKHIKFAIKSCIAPTCELKTFNMLVWFLPLLYDIPAEFFDGQGVISKSGLVSFPDTEYKASIRLWNSKKVGKSVIYELTVSSYKDAVPKQLDDKPCEYKKI